MASELAGYGFRRNLLGLRPLGIGLSAASAVLAVAVAVVAVVHHRHGHVVAFGATCAVDLVALITWIKVVTSEWVRVQGFAYAQALLGAAEKLEVATTHAP